MGIKSVSGTTISEGSRIGDEISVRAKSQFKEIFEEIRKNNRQRKTILHHDNAICYTSAETTRFSEGQKIELTGHPPYSSDLAPKDLFPSVKNKLRSQRFSGREEAIDAFKMYFRHVQTNGDGLTWPRRWRRTAAALGQCARMDSSNYALKALKCTYEFSFILELSF
ncbi:Mariner Mos1 transposase [Eumeta japonica]|uniref:Mariner Mos1 transposase n=1 Tax=Eumeta variegata TaxID=151549 RepID=A0A4C1ZDV1_EUMVA|nr:Mariner Mos1 transposase [Eumeta japonica]